MKTEGQQERMAKTSHTSRNPVSALHLFFCWTHKTLSHHSNTLTQIPTIAWTQCFHLCGAMGLSLMQHQDLKSSCEL